MRGKAPEIHRHDGVADARTEFSFHLALDDEHHIAETGAPCVEQGKINDEVPLRIDRLDLLEPPRSGCTFRQP